MHETSNHGAVPDGTSHEASGHSRFVGYVIRAKSVIQRQLRRAVRWSIDLLCRGWRRIRGLAQQHHQHMRYSAIYRESVRRVLRKSVDRLPSAKYGDLVRFATEAYTRFYASWSSDVQPDTP